MALKRKRSSSELCSSPSASSTCSSAFSFSSPPTSTTQAPIFWDSSNVSRNLFAAPAHLNSRTMKRFRDGRPSEEMVHQRTLNILFSAQQQQHQAQPVVTSTQAEEPIETAPNNTTQHSLHRFWAISSAPKPPTASTHFAPHQQQVCVACEDCGASLDSGMMDVDGASSGACACGACGKHVCFSCSVSNLGEEKRCLQCAGRSNMGGAWTEGAMQMT